MTPRQLQTLEFIEGCWNQQHYGPSYKDIGKHLEVKSDETVRGLLFRLRDHGWGTWSPKHHRSVRSLRTPAGGVVRNGADAGIDARIETGVEAQTSPLVPRP